jgi:hypothetical protein
MSRVSSKEAAQLVRLLEATPEAQRHEGWPPLLTLLTRWAAQGAVLPHCVAAAWCLAFVGTDMNPP